MHLPDYFPAAARILLPLLLTLICSLLLRWCTAESLSESESGSESLSGLSPPHLLGVSWIA